MYVCAASTTGSPTSNTVKSPPSAYFDAENSAPLLGEPVVDAAQTYTVSLTVIPWRTGALTTPETLIFYRTGAADAPQSLRVMPQTFNVPSTLDASPELRVSREVWGLPYPRVLLLALVVGAGAAVMIGGAYGLQRYFQRRPRRLLGGLTRTLAQRTVYRLSRVHAEAPDIIAQYAAMGDILREYVQALLMVDAVDMTTRELLDELAGDDALSPARRKELRYLLDQADLAKFAPAKVYAPQELSLLRLASQWVQAVDEELSA